MLYARWERALGDRPPSFVRPGSWIGGDRDGNPFVTADSLRLALSRGSATAIGDYLDRASCPGRRNCRSRRASPGSIRRCGSLPAPATTITPTREDEPYRRAISGIYARLSATYEALTRSGSAARPNQFWSLWNHKFCGNSGCRFVSGVFATTTAIVSSPGTYTVSAFSGSMAGEFTALYQARRLNQVEQLHHDQSSTKRLALNRKFCNSCVIISRTIKGGSDYFTLNRACISVTSSGRSSTSTTIEVTLWVISL